MNEEINAQILALEAKLRQYESKKASLQRRAHLLELRRKEIDNLQVGDPQVEWYYKRLDNIYSQIHSLPAKIRKCKDFIVTLKCEL